MMRKFYKVMLTLALVFGAVGGVNSVKATKTYASFSVATGCTWASNTMSFTDVNGWQILRTGLPGNDISAYTTFHATLSNLSDNIDGIRLRIKDKSDKYADYNLVDGENVVDLAALASANPSCNFKNIDDITIWSPTSAAAGKTVDGENPASVVITNTYMEKPTTLEFDNVGKASTIMGDLYATGGLSYEPSTGTLTTDGTEGTLVLEFTSAVDLQYLNKLEITKSGDADIVDKIYFYEDDACTVENQSWSYSKWGGTTDANATSKFTGKTIKKVVWKSAAGKSTTLTVTISSITWELKTISALKGVDITALPFKNWSADGDNDATVTGNINWWECSSNFNKYTSDVIYGGDGIGGSKRYVDLSSYKKLIIRGYGTIRLFYNWQADPEDKPMEYIGIAGSVVDTYELDLDAFKASKGISHFHLVGVKGSGACFVESISALDGTETADYNISGVGYQLSSVSDALADADVTAIDATGLSNTSAISLVSANPNCLFIANAGKLSNANNVIVSDVCANLVLTDGKPFKAPSEFTATASSYSRAFVADKTTTVCLPFALTAAEAATLGKFYEFDSFAGGTLHFTSVDAPAANTPYLVVPTATSLTLSETDKSIVATPAALNTTVGDIDFIGTMAATSIPASGSGAAEYSYYAYNNGEFVKIVTAAATLPAFRAYFKVLNSAITSAPALNVIFDDAEVTGISQIEEAAVKMQNVFDLQGRRVAQPTKGLYIVNGKKVVIK